MEAAVSKDHCIPSAWIVRGLAKAGTVHVCRSCGGRMFVKYASGLCPICWNGRGPERVGAVAHVLAERALAGVLDDPATEGDCSHAAALASPAPA